MTTHETTQADRDRMTFDMYVDCGLSASETARQMGIARSTVQARVSRHSQRLAAANIERRRKLAEHTARRSR